jgi:flagellar biosynthesis protein FlhF
MPGRRLPVRLRTYKAYSHEQALQAARGDLGSNLRIIHTRSVRRPGLRGFWMRPIIELTVELVSSEKPVSDPRVTTATQAYAGLSHAKAEDQEVPLDMDLERAKTQRLAQALAVKLEKESALRSNAARNERLVEQTADLQQSLVTRAKRPGPPKRDSVHIDAPSEQVARRFMLVPDKDRGQRVEERQALLEDEGAEALQSSPVPAVEEPIRGAVRRAVAEEGIQLGDFAVRTDVADTARSEPELLRSVYAHLIEQEVTRELADELIAEIIEEVGPGGICNVDRVQEAAHSRIAAMLPIDESPLDAQVARASSKPYVVALVGPTGVGKTTTIAKLAAACRFRDGLSVGLLTTDSFRMAAVEQLRSYAEILKIPLEVVIEPEEMQDALHRLKDRDVILIDSAGRSRRDHERLGQLRAFLEAANPDETHLVLSTTSGERTMLRDADAFASLGADRVVLTKLDETDGFGVILNVIRRLGTRISFVTTGQEVPDDIEQGGAGRIARMLLQGVLTNDGSGSLDVIESEAL